MIKIAWITPTPFVDVDLPIIAELQNNVEIYWQIVVFGKVYDDLKNYVESQLKENIHIRYEYIEIPYRVFDVKTLGMYRKVIKKAQGYNPDIVYTSLETAPFGPWVYKLYFDTHQIVTACHNVSTPKGANQERYNRFYTGWLLRAFQNIQVFSDSQRDILIQKHPNKNILLAPLAIKDYGEPTKPAERFDENLVVFLFFGIISPYKRVDLLIEAAQNLYERGYRNFKVKIAGSCKNWDDYSSIIQYPELFDTRIERIPNSEVADLFAECDYFVMPYRDIAQSGAITVAYRYNLPILLSDLPQFKPFCVDGKTGFFFECGNVVDLEEKMIKVVEGGATMYDNLSKGLSDFVRERYSTPAIAKKYMDYFEALIKR